MRHLPAHAGRRVLTVADTRPLGRLEGALGAGVLGGVNLIPFIPAGFGGFATTKAAVRGAAEAGASAIEIGIPFSDPIADGPVIQAAYHEALTGGTTLVGVLDCARAIRAELAVPMLAMVSYSIAFRIGPKEFCDQAKVAGFDGLLCPDLPPPEAAPFCATARAAGLEPVILVAPTTPPARRAEIGRLAGGFVYYLSVAGVTGERSELPENLAPGVRDMKSRTSLPVCVGFGISRREQVVSLRGVADGAVVGTAYVKRIREQMQGGPASVQEAVARLTRELLGG